MTWDPWRQLISHNILGADMMNWNSNNPLGVRKELHWWINPLPLSACTQLDELIRNCLPWNTWPSWQFLPFETPIFRSYHTFKISHRKGIQTETQSSAISWQPEVLWSRHQKVDCTTVATNYCVISEKVFGQYNPWLCMVSHPNQLLVQWKGVRNGGLLTVSNGNTLLRVA